MSDPLLNTPGHLASPDKLVNLPRLLTAFYANHPDPENPAQRVSFGTSGHRGSSLASSFNYAHILAITQAIVEYRAKQGTTGPLFLAMDTHALSEPAFTTALEVLAANDVTTLIDDPMYLQRHFQRSSHFKKQADATGWDPTPCSSK